MLKYLDKIKYYFANLQNTQMFRIKHILKPLFIVNKNYIKNKHENENVILKLFEKG